MNNVALKKLVSILLSSSMLLSLVNVTTASAEGYDYYVEAEHFTESNWKTSAGGKIQNKAAYSNGKYLNLFTDFGDVEEFYTEYTIVSEKDGIYALDMASTPLKQGWSSPVYMSVNGSESVMLQGVQFQTIPNDTQVAWYHAGTLNLKEGNNTIRFSIRDGRDSDKKAMCYIDCFALTETEFKLKEIKSPAPLQTFQQGEELRFEIWGEGPALKDVYINYDVLDFEGKYIDGGDTVIKKGSPSAEFVLKNKKNGAYQIIANNNGETILQQFLVVTNLKDRKKLKDSPFGIDSLMYGMRNDVNKALVEDYASLLELTGVTWTRDRVYFDNYVTKEGDKFTFKMPHTEITGNALEARGINVSMAMDLQPKLLRENDYGDVMPTNLFDVYNFWKQLAERYDGAVDNWEIQNEIDLGGGGSNKDGADIYASMFKAAALGIMDSDTENEVYISPFGAAGKPGHTAQHIELLFENDIYDYTGIANFHVHESVSAPYSNYYSYYGTYVPQGYIDLSAEHGYSIAEWNGESGISLDVPVEINSNAEQQMVQAKYLVTSYVEDLASGTDKKFFFDGISRNEGAKSWGMTSRSKTSPSAYAAYGTLSAMTHVLGEGAYLGKLKGMPEGVLAHAFADGDDTAVVYYSTSETGEQYNFALNTGKMSVRHFDIFANEKKLYSQNGVYSLTASEYPQYIKFTGRLNADAFTDDKVDELTPMSETQKSVEDSKRIIILQKYDTKTRNTARIAGYNLEDETNGVDIEVFNFNDYPVSGVINGKSAGGWEIQPAAQPIQIAPMSSETIHFDIIPDTFKSQEDRITFYGDMDCGRTSDSVVRAVGKKVVDIQPKIVSGEKFLSVRINNSSDTEKVVKSAKLVVNGNTVEYYEPVTIAPKETGIFDIPAKYEDTDKTLVLSGEIEFTDGTKANYNGETPFAVAKRDISSLSGTPSFILPDDGEIQSQFYYGKEDLYGEFYVGADKENFYFGGNVIDNNHSAPKTGYDIWNNDGVQFTIGKGLPAVSIPYYEVGVSLTDEGVCEAYYWIDPDKTGHGKLEGISTKITRNEETKTTTYFVAIPWSVIPRISYEDGLVAFSMIVNENDGAGRNGYIEWGSGIGARKDPSKFRTIVFDK